MIEINEIPRSGVIIISVYFSSYKDSYANDTRRYFEGSEKIQSFIDRLHKKGFSAEMIPFGYWLGRTVIEKVTRATGGLYKYGYSQMTADDFLILKETLEEKKNKTEGWDEVEILIANRVEIC